MSLSAARDDEVVRHYQAFLHRRRAQRPAEEYHQVTGREWREFEEHFDRRKIELGNCGPPVRNQVPARARLPLPRPSS